MVRSQHSRKAALMRNAEAAVQFLQMCARGDVREAYKRHAADDFLHHNAWFAGDRESLARAMEESASSEPNKSFDVRQVVDGGDKVAVLSCLRRLEGGAQYAVVHIFRFDAGKIVELWDLGQEVPMDSPNQNGMF